MSSAGLYRLECHSSRSWRERDHSGAALPPAKVFGTIGLARGVQMSGTKKIKWYECHWCGEPTRTLDRHLPESPVDEFPIYACARCNL